MAVITRWSRGRRLFAAPLSSDTFWCYRRRFDAETRVRQCRQEARRAGDYFTPTHTSAIIYFRHDAAAIHEDFVISTPVSFRPSGMLFSVSGLPRISRRFPFS